MVSYIRFESKQDLEWLVTVVSNAVLKTRSNPSLYCDIADIVERVADTLAAPMVLEDVAAMLGDDLIEEEARKPVRKRRSAEEVAADKVQRLCDVHVGYTARRRPSTDCKTCWAAYKKFNPTKYAAAKRSFDQKQRQRKKEA